jgi:chemotaxis protein methyltransferase CheR
MPNGASAGMVGYSVQLSQKEFLGFRRMIFEQAGIHLSDAKKSLVSGRLAKRLGQREIDSYGEYLALIQHDAAERQMAIDLLTTNETYFYREPQHFDFLARQLVPTLKGKGSIRVWCAASSTGEEPYTIAMTLAEALGHLRFEILASDISTRVLNTARKALYPMDDAANIPKGVRARHCLKGIGSQDGWFLIDKPLRDRIRFEQINLNARLPDVGSFDIIFLRNVMIYFNTETKQGVIKRLMPHLRDEGHLFISHSESLHGVTDALQMVKPSVYRKR